MSMTDTAPPGGLIAHLDDDAGRSELNAAPAEESAPERRQPGHLVELLIEGEDPYRVRILNRDKIAYDKARARHREWPAPEEGRNFAMTFYVWSAARREKRTTATFDAWQELLEDFDVIAETSADPTR